MENLSGGMFAREWTEQTNEKQSWIERAMFCGQGKKIVYFKCDAKDEQNRSIRGRIQLPI